MKIVYTGPGAIEQPGLGFVGATAWQPGETRDVPDVYAETWLVDPEAPYARPGTKAAKDAALGAEVSSTPPRTTEEVS